MDGKQRFSRKESISFISGSLIKVSVLGVSFLEGLKTLVIIIHF